MNGNSPNIPKYYSISQEIISSIRSGEFLPGMRISSENELIAKYNISNTTARKILGEIQNAGWVTRIKGKGTFVITRDVERPVTRILGFHRNMYESGLKPSTVVIERKVIKKGYSDTVNGRIYRMKHPVLQIKRMRYADGIPMMLEKRYISLNFCPGIEKMNFEGSLYDLYNKYDLNMSEINQMLSSVIINENDTMDMFGIREPIPAFLVKGVTFCGKEMILEMEESLYRGDKYRFSVRAT